jgi:hypothetical protein
VLGEAAGMLQHSPTNQNNLIGKRANLCGARVDNNVISMHHNNETIEEMLIYASNNLIIGPLIELF